MAAIATFLHMAMPQPLTPENCITTYILAKDGNRPHLLDTAFSPAASLTMRVYTDAIAFPAEVRGRAAIADALVSQFNKCYENIYTFCIGEPPGTNRHFACGWLVCMTEKDTGAARVGYGRYEWIFAPGVDGRVEQLAITIEAMSILTAGNSAAVLDWAATLPYPWCPVAQLRQGGEAMSALAPMLEALARLAAGLG